MDQSIRRIVLITHMDSTALNTAMTALITPNNPYATNPPVIIDSNEY